MAKVEKDVSKQACLVNRMQQEKPAKSRQKSGVGTPSERQVQEEELQGHLLSNKRTERVSERKSERGALRRKPKAKRS